MFSTASSLVNPAQRREADLMTRTRHVALGTAPPAGGKAPDDLADPPGESDEEVIRRYACIHFPHKLSPLMHQTLAHPQVVAALIRVIGPDVKAMQSMLFTKGEGKPGQAWHQDEFFIPTRDRSLTAAWIALVNHYMSAQSLLPWTRPPADVHVGKWDCRDIVMVAGNDPYAWRGTTDTSRPYVRPDKDGGCHR
jgi:Phytanoyl-CoA dioxygenase (PhyH)